MLSFPSFASVFSSSVPPLILSSFFLHFFLFSLQSALVSSASLADLDVFVHNSFCTFWEPTTSLYDRSSFFRLYISLIIASFIIKSPSLPFSCLFSLRLLWFAPFFPCSLHNMPAHKTLCFGVILCQIWVYSINNFNIGICWHNYFWFSSFGVLCCLTLIIFIKMLNLGPFSPFRFVHSPSARSYVHCLLCLIICSPTINFLSLINSFKVK